MVVECTSTSPIAQVYSTILAKHLRSHKKSPLHTISHTMTSNELQSLLHSYHTEKVPTRSTVQAYWDLTRLAGFPTGSELIFWPCGTLFVASLQQYDSILNVTAAWGAMMAAYHTSLPLSKLTMILLAFLIGSPLFHASICVLNDICDRDCDRQVGQ
jgi:4-hydroxybenzoate polyprenyltransferase